MKRRDFLKSTGAAAGLAVVPLPATGAAATTAQPARYVWAVSLAKARGHVSAEALCQSLKLPMGEAQALIARLQTRGVVGALGANGVARASTPLMRAGVLTSATGSTTAKVGKSLADTGTKLLRRAAEQLTSTDDPEPPEVSDEARSAE